MQTAILLSLGGLLIFALGMRLGAGASRWQDTARLREQAVDLVDGIAEARDALFALAHDWTDRSGISRHYLHLGERQRRTYFSDHSPFPTKKLFYALRPAMALRWLRLHPDDKLPPMHLPDLVAEAEVPTALAATVDRLVAQKAITRELGMTNLPPEIASFIESEFELGRAILSSATAPSDAAREAGAATFRNLVEIANA